MAPRENIKATPKGQRTKSPSTSSAVKTQCKLSKVNTTKTRPPCTPKRNKKETKPAPVPGSVSKSAKKRRKPMAAHSGVPMPSKMQCMLMKQQAAGALRPVHTGMATTGSDAASTSSVKQI